MTSMPSRWQRYQRAHPRATDLALAVVSVFISFPGVVASIDGAELPSPRWLGYLLTGAACAALIEVRRHARAVAVVTIACATVSASIGYTLSPLLLAPTMIALAFVAQRASHRVSYVFTGAAIVILLTTTVIANKPGSPLSLELIGTAAWLPLAVVLGRAGRLRSAYIEAADARAEYAERTREEEAMRQVASERMRIARELHDVVAHHLALANAQAGTVAYLMDNDPGKARLMAGDLSRTIATALEDLGVTVGLLRQADDSDSPLEPAPGLEQLPQLTASFAAAGLEVRATTDGETRTLPSGVDLTAYRIIQEALTNITKHSAAPDARVHLTYTHDQLTVIVTDNGGKASLRSAATPPAPSGYGLIGMRERTQALGGRLRTGPLPGGGFEVVAELPLHLNRRDEENRAR